MYNYYLYTWLVISTPLKNMNVRLDHHPNIWKNKINVPNH